MKVKLSLGEVDPKIFFEQMIESAINHEQKPSVEIKKKI